MTSPIQGIRGTGEFDVDFRPKNYRELYLLLEPNGSSPLNALLSMGTSESTDDPVYKNFRDELPDRVVTVDGAIASDSTSAVTLTTSEDNRYAVQGAILVSGRTGEVMHVQADVTGTGLTVTRNIGGTNHHIDDQDQLFVAGSAAAEGSGAPTAITWDATVHENYTQIFKTPFGVTNTMNETYLRTGSKLEETAQKALKLHMSDLERAMFFGRKHEDLTSASTPLRFTGGLMEEITNVIDCASDTANANIMTEPEFDDFLISNIFKYGSSQKLLFGGPKLINNLQQIAKQRWQPNAVSGTYGISFTHYATFAGDLMVHLHPQFRQIPDMEYACVILDFPHLRYRYMDNRDTHLVENLQANDEDLVKHQYLTECGMELLQAKVHTVIRNWQGITTP